LDSDLDLDEDTVFKKNKNKNEDMDDTKAEELSIPNNQCNQNEDLEEKLQESQFLEEKELF